MSFKVSNSTLHLIQLFLFKNLKCASIRRFYLYPLAGVTELNERGLLVQKAHTNGYK